MEIDDRISSFIQLGNLLRSVNEGGGHPLVQELREAAIRASNENPWFIPGFIEVALNALGLALEKENLHQWIDTYLSAIRPMKKTGTVGVVMAGNLPAVGFHDFLCVLMSGNKIKAKLSASDRVLLPALAGVLTGIDPRWKEQIAFIEGKLSGFDAVIATGNDNTSRYFDFYFGRYPNIIRKNRNGVAILDGNENDASLTGIAADIMLYFGMGCRSVSKIYVPEGYGFQRLTEKLGDFRYLINHHKYANNYQYRKTIRLMNHLPFLDTGFLLVCENRPVSSPIAILNYQYYKEMDDVYADIRTNYDSIQCIVSGNPLPFPVVMPGKAHYPGLWEYSDRSDTMHFLLTCFS